MEAGALQHSSARIHGHQPERWGSESRAAVSICLSLSLHYICLGVAMPVICGLQRLQDSPEPFRCHIVPKIFPLEHFFSIIWYVCWGGGLLPWKFVPGTRVTDCCELLSGCWESNHRPLEVQSVLLNPAISPEPVWSVLRIQCECTWEVTDPLLSGAMGKHS